MTVETRVVNRNRPIFIVSDTAESRRLKEIFNQKSIPSIIKNKTIPYYDCCETPAIIEAQGIFVCQNCAIVHEPMMKEGLFSDEDTRHVEIIISANKLPSQGSRTTFSFENLSSEKRMLFRRLGRLNSFYRNSVESNSVIANRFLLTIASQLEIPKPIQNGALRLYKKVLDAKLTMGRSIKQLMVACLYVACNLKKYPCHISDFVKVSQISEKSIRKNYRILLTKFKIRLQNFGVTTFLEKYLTELDLPPQFQQAVRKSIELLRSQKIKTNINPRGFSVAAIYVVSKMLFPTPKIKQKALTVLSKVSEVTIRKYVKIFVENIDFQTLFH